VVDLLGDQRLVNVSLVWLHSNQRPKGQPGPAVVIPTQEKLFCDATPHSSPLVKLSTAKWLVLVVTLDLIDHRHFIAHDDDIGRFRVCKGLRQPMVERKLLLVFAVTLQQTGTSKQRNVVIEFSGALDTYLDYKRWFAIRVAAHYFWKRKIDLLMSFHRQTFFFKAARCGDNKTIEEMLRDGLADPSHSDNLAIQSAAEGGYIAIVERLLQDERVDPSAADNKAIRSASENGHLAVVERLLQDARVDPSADNNCAVGLAARYGHLAVFDRLLQDERVDPSAKDNCIVLWAAQNDHLAVVERLLQDERFDPSANDNYVVKWAAYAGHLVLVERLLQDERVDPSADDNHAVRLAAFYGHLAVVERLLRDARVDPSAKDNCIVLWAALYDHFAVVDRLLEDDRVDVSALVGLDPEHRKLFECRERLTEICIGMQAMQLPAWVTLQILDAARPGSTLQLHSKWNLVCAVKHFHDRRTVCCLSFEREGQECL
jgi:Ankyrin repeats (3 copies)